MSLHDKQVRMGIERDQGLDNTDYNGCSEANQLSRINISGIDGDRLPIVAKFQKLFGPQR